MSDLVPLKQGFTGKLERYSEEDRARILSALRWADGLHHEQKRASGEPFFVHPLSVAEILVDAHMDAQTVIAALLHDTLEDTGLTRRELRREYGKEVEALVGGVTKISQIRGMSKTAQQAETIRKMLFAMVKDIRVIMIKLADKLHNMRTLEYLEEASRKRIATECLEIYAPLAGRLGMSRMKDELEDLSFRVLNPRAWEQIQRWVDEGESERSGFLQAMEQAVRREAEAAGIPIQVESRIKHFYSIYRKMRKKGRALDEMYDLVGMRLLCDTTGQCYELLGLVHSLWMPIEGRFKDYIAMPKSNLYQSLHTTVMGNEGKMLEIQIRTQAMHRTAEEGIAAHWLYKPDSAGRAIKAEQLTIINMLKSWDSSAVASPDFLEEIKRELLKDSIYVFTPKGDVIEMPKGATALDFAYHIHTEVGNHCAGAKADGVPVQLKEELANTQVIEILTAQNARPHLNWLRFAKTHRARGKIRHWLALHEPDLIFDRNIVARKKAESPPPPPPKPAEKPAEPETRILDQSKVGVRIGEERNLMIRIAGCCQPASGDRIVGYVSRGRGIIVHRADCPNVRHIPDIQERHVEVQWETVSPKATRRFQVTARVGGNLFSEVEGALKKFRGHLIEGKLEDGGLDVLEGFFTVELDNAGDFGKVMKSLRTVPSVVNIRTAG
ncbi:MAG: (p)ppGpp synthetase [Spirochaetes bacterium RBG_16_67_19]|nr:MAG: (p)ppGpp synthetase [Spirochaetes bacterium RBG_16_67_19]